MLSVIDVRTNPYYGFGTIAVEISSKCNRRCAFCPNAYYERPDEYMSWEMYSQILQELATIKYHRRLELYIYNEPMRDKRLLEMIKMARSVVPRACIMINTNADYIRTRADIDAMLDAGLNQLGINIYSNEMRYKQLLEMTAHLPDGSLYQDIGPRKVAVKVLPKYELYMNKDVNIPGVAHLSNRAGSIPDFLPSVEEPWAKMCTRPFRLMYVNWRGEGALCCNDYYTDVDIGTFPETSLTEMWNSNVYNIFRLKLQNKNRYMPLCDVCDFDGGSYRHMIHPITFGKDIDEWVLGLDLRNPEDLYAVACDLEDYL